MEFTSRELEAKILGAPELPGCYIYRDSNSKVLYVGKAQSLRNRVKQYFDGSDERGTRIFKMVAQIRDVEYVITDSETEALILETNLIKKYRPKYNVLMKDDKNYQWLLIDLREDFPKPVLVRDQKLKHKKALYFGPFNASLPLKRTLRLLRQIFPYRTCNRQIRQVKLKNSSHTEYEIRSSDPKPCLFYFLGLCPAPCAGFVNKENYGENIRAIRKFFENRKDELIKELREDMYTHAANQEFEAAAKSRDRMNDLISISQKIDVGLNTDEYQFRSIKAANKAQALSDLLDIIGNEELKIHSNFKIECYDISNIQGKLAVGSMVVFINGFPANRLYRKFRIKKLDTPNDFAMLKEVFGRRFGKLVENVVPDEETKTELPPEKQPDKKPAKPDPSFSVPPDLIVVDGGKGQLSSVYKVLTELGVNIPVVGLAKRYEDVFIPEELIEGELNFIKKTLPLGSQARFLMQRIRDEAHRFGITYHRNLRLKAQKFSVLSEIPGVGEVIGNKLLKAFGTLDGIRNASADELNQVVKNKKTVAKIKQILV